MVTRPLRVLLLLRGGAEGAPLVRELRQGGYGVTMELAGREEVFHAALDRGGWDVVLAASGVPDLEWAKVLGAVGERTPETPIILIAREDEEEAAASFMRRGAHDYVLEGHLHRLVSAVDRALRAVEDRRLRREVETALRRADERFLELVENANDVVFTTDLSGTFTSLNKAGEQISGYTREEVCMMNMAQILAPESLILARQMIQQKLIDNRPTVYQLDIIARDGHRVPLEASTRLILHDGHPVAIQGIARDITERKRAAEALRESEERYRGLFEKASDIVYTHDLFGLFTSVNQAAENVTGYAREEILQLSIADIVAPEHLEQARLMIQHKLFDRGTTTYELDILSRDGVRRRLEINSQLIHRGGRPVGVQGIARDVTERRRAEEALRARERQQAAVAELGQAALATTEPERVFHDAARCIVTTLEIEYCALLEFLPAENVLVSRSGSGWRSGLREATVGAGRESPSGYALYLDEPLIVEDLLADTRFAIPDILVEHGVRSAMSVKVHGPDRPFGVLSAYSTARRHFTQDDVHFLQSVANVLGAAIDRTRLEEERTRHNKELATRVLQAQEEERKRIARELHDETAQSLSMLLTHLDLLEPYVSQDHVELRAGFDRVAELARRTLDETRALSHDLRPTILDDAGLSAALHWLGEEYEETFGISVHVRNGFQPRDALPPEMEVALFRIAQEALTNSCKHAAASMATISLDMEDRDIHLTIEDDGKGFDPRQVPKPTREGRLGLYGMHERATLLGGSLEILPAPTGGTRVEVTIPLTVSSIQEER